MWLVNLGKLGHAAMCTGKLGLRLAGLPHQGDGLGLAVACQVREAAAAVASQHGDLLLALWWCRWLMWRLEVVRTCLATMEQVVGRHAPPCASWQSMQRPWLACALCFSHAVSVAPQRVHAPAAPWLGGGTPSGR